MFADLYKWIQDLVFFLILSTALLQVLPRKEYQRYVRFFTGLVLILLLLSPLLKLTGMEDDLRAYTIQKEQLLELQEEWEDQSIEALE